MPVVDGRTRLEVLSPPACWRLLSPRHVGRIGFVLDDRPEILPVNYLVDDHTILFRTEKGRKWSAALAGAAMAFEVDAANPDLRTGWSVLVKGTAEEVLAPSELRRLRNLPLRPWALGDKPHWIRIRPHEVTGRRIVKSTPSPVAPAGS